MQRIQLVGIGRTAIGALKRDSADLAREALQLAFADARIAAKDVDALIATPSLSSGHFMHAHYLATTFQLTSANPKMLLKTVDTGGASPISAIGAAMDLFRRMPQLQTTVIVASDAVHSLPSAEFAKRSNESIPSPYLVEPHIPHGYDFYAQWQMKRYGLKREQLAMVPVLMSSMSTRHPDAMCKRRYTLEEVLHARPIAPVTNLPECARRADGAVALVLAREDYYKIHASVPPSAACKPYVLSVGEASGPLYPPANMEDVTPELFSYHRAVNLAYEAAGGLTAADIDFFGLYDCFPICFIRALEGCGLCKKGEGGQLVEQVYRRAVQNGGDVDPNTFPVNTHGGLMCFGAPWEVPAMYNVTEAAAQLSGQAGARQISPTPKRALVYGNGGVFSASAVAILSTELP
ncbi:putative sterol carrier protein [Leptomonas seymouri]|uniref:Putative sterol carrier protein n=1 Tax=Leptomonas seymouri TaxID=5684 RepID=A0A0N1HUB7_LEPSE|nr:putative sterol carrier protein [Leptomonas seymouri]|eukprot:KPI83761.1 putative sterol carrier protein [Leptomonas seymouri]